MKKLIQKIANALVWILVPIMGFAQANRPSPPHKVSNTVGNTTITIDYSQPSVKGRTVWGELVPYGKVWRTGANEATVFEVSNDVIIDGKTLKAGKYSLFSIPEKEEWTIIFSSETGQWGTRYNQEKDVLRIKAKPQKVPVMTEKMTFDINNKGVVTLLWENLKVDFKVTPAKQKNSKT